MKSVLKFWIILVMGFGLLQPVRAQISLPFSGGEYNESDPLHVGIHFTYRISHYVIAHKQGWDSMPVPLTGGGTSTFTSISSYPSGHNIGVGIPVDWRVNGNLNLMFSPTFYPQFDGLYPSESISFQYDSGHEEEKRTRRIGGADELNFASFDFPLHLKFRSDEKYINRRAGIGRYKLYMLSGGKFTTNIDRNKHYDAQLGGLNVNQYPLIAKSGFASWEVGAGVDLFFPYFKMSLETRFAQSFSSVLDHDSRHAAISPFMAPIERARLRSVQFTVILE